MTTNPTSPHHYRLIMDMRLIFSWIQVIYLFQVRDSYNAMYSFHRLGVPEQALGGIPLGFGIVVEDKLFTLYAAPPSICYAMRFASL